MSTAAVACVCTPLPPRIAWACHAISAATGHCQGGQACWRTPGREMGHRTGQRTLVVARWRRPGREVGRWTRQRALVVAHCRTPGRVVGRWTGQHALVVDRWRTPGREGAGQGCAARQGGGGGGLGPAPLAAVAEFSPTALLASGTPFCSAVGWAFWSADRTNAPPPCGQSYGCALCPRPQGAVARSSAARRVGGPGVPPPWRPLLGPPPRPSLHQAALVVAPSVGFSGLLTVLTPRTLVG